ncbi:hypothetical protein BSZ39_08135 [Bowdeniella nasicola]|uniref:Uncharacterized protein n=2 Tax=Bowdeniella nasicola TaxID=208480 RepID=A0A1Q5Q1H1_9ACTO|nr:hypothetical protein BSZ39_08135 [Bowdeniella nasicola]
MENMTTARFGSITAVVVGALLLISGVAVSLLSLGSPQADTGESAFAHDAGIIRDGESMHLSAGTRVLLETATRENLGCTLTGAGRTVTPTEEAGEQVYAIEATGDYTVRCGVSEDILVFDLDVVVGEPDVPVSFTTSFFIGVGMGVFGMALLIGGIIWLTVAGRERMEWT